MTYLPLVLKLDPELEEGNTEYKRKLISSGERLTRLVSQLKFRLAEGQGEAVYYIGVEDDGRPVGITRKELDKSLRTLEWMTQKLNCAIVSKTVHPGVSTKSSLTAKVVVKEKSLCSIPTEIRGVVLGGSQNGKSTLIASLITGKIDNGAGLVRMHVLKHKHELDNGCTSCVSTHTLGFDKEGSPMLKEEEEIPTGVFFNEVGGKQEQTESLDRFVSFVDVPGHRKYLKTTIKGFMAFKPAFALVTISGEDLIEYNKFMNSGNIKLVSKNSEQDPPALMEKNGLDISLLHWKIALMLGINIVLVITKIDLLSMPSKVNLMDAINKLTNIMGETNTVACFEPRGFSPGELPVFFTSCVDQTGIAVLRSFLGHIELNVPMVNALRNQNTCFYLRDTFDVLDVGIVADGICSSGELSQGDIINVGPDRHGSFHNASISSIRTEQGHRTQSVSAGQSACIALDAVSAYSILRSSELSQSVKGYDISDRSRTTREENLNSFHMTFIENTKEHGITRMSGTSSCRITINCNHYLQSFMRKGAVLLKDSTEITIVLDFEVKLIGMIDLSHRCFHTGTKKILRIKPKSHFVVYVNSIRQPACVRRVERTSESYIVSFSFIKRPEYLQVNEQLLLLNGSLCGIARIHSLNPLN